MNATHAGSPTVQSRTDELAQAWQLLSTSLPKKLLNELQPSAPQAVYDTWVTVWLMVFPFLHGNASLNATVTAFLQDLNDLADPKRKRVHEQTLSPNTGALSQARSRLKVDVANIAADHVFRSLVPATSGKSLGIETPVFVVDGSSISLPSHDALRKIWVPNRNQHGEGPWPICFLALAFEWKTGLAVRPETGVMYGSGAESELTIAKRLLSRIPRNSLLLADRLYGNFTFWYQAKAQGFDLVTRFNENMFKSMKKNCPLEAIRPGVWKCRWQPSAKIRRHHPQLPADAEVEIYLYEFAGHAGQTMMVGSSRLLTIDQIAELYARRGDIETDIRHWKTTLEAKAFRSRSPDMVHKEIAMSTIAFNLIVQVRATAAARGKIAPRRLSFTGVATLVQVLMKEFGDRSLHEMVETFDRILRQCLARKLPNRKKRRSYPRTAYTRHSKFPPKKRVPPDSEKK